MSPTILENPADLNEPVDAKDPYAYGWRYVKKNVSNGSTKLVKVPLTLEDILHPQEEDFRVLTNAHRLDCQYLAEVIEASLVEKSGAQLLADCRVAWDAKGKYGHGPDIAVVFNVGAVRDWGTFNVVKEGTKPALIVEVTSPSTRSTDLVDKVREYAEVGVPHYVIADACRRKGVRTIALIDYHLDPKTSVYWVKPIEENGRVWLPEVQLWLGVDDGRLACYDLNGRRKGTYTEVDVARKEAERLVAEEKRSRVKADKKTEEAVRAKVTAENHAANLEARVRELEQQMRRRNGKHKEDT